MIWRPCCEVCGITDRAELGSCTLDGEPALFFCRPHYYEHVRDAHGIGPVKVTAAADATAVARGDMGDKLIEEAWNSYKRSVLPPNVSRVQEVETRRAFYGGAHALLTGIMGMLEPGSEPTHGDLLRLCAIVAELGTFKQSVSDGSA